MDRPQLTHMALFTWPHTISLDRSRRSDCGSVRAELTREKMPPQREKRKMRRPLHFYRDWKKMSAGKFPRIRTLATVNSVVHQHRSAVPSAADHLFPIREEPKKQTQLRQQISDSMGPAVKLRFSLKRGPKFNAVGSSSTIVAGSKTPQAGILRSLMFGNRTGEGPVQISVHNTVASGEIKGSVNLSVLGTHYRANPTTNFPGLPMTIENGDDDLGKGKATVS